MLIDMTGYWVALGDNVLIRVADISAVVLQGSILRIRMRGAERSDEYVHDDAAAALTRFNYIREQVLGIPPQTTEGA